jgi:fucose permease
LSSRIRAGSTGRSHAVKAGLAFLPLAVAALAGNAAGAQLAVKLGNRYVILSGMLLMAASFGLLTTLSADSGFTVPAVALGVLGLGAGLAMPAAVAALMSTIAEEKAGVGSALNDTVQQSGTALGVAILGSLLSGGYTGEMPAGAPEQARESIGGALAVAGDDTGLVRAAREAFTASTSTTFTISAVGVLAAAVVATLVMRDHKSEQTEQAEDSGSEEHRLAARRRSFRPADEGRHPGEGCRPSVMSVPGGSGRPPLGMPSRFSLFGVAESSTLN